MKEFPLLIDIKLHHRNAKTPTKSYDTDVGWDFYAIEDIFIEPNYLRYVDIGLSLNIPEGWYLHFYPRSSLSNKNVLVLAGIIDSGYTKPLSLLLRNDRDETLYIEKGDRIAQGAFLPVPKVKFRKLSKKQEHRKTKRGTRGFGSSGK